VKRIAAAGHEVACHGYDHELVYDSSPPRFAESTRRALSVIRDIVGENVIGYRAASFSLPRTERQWVYEILAEQGIRYDSSIFPIRRKFYGHPDASWDPIDIATASGVVREFPMPVVSLAGQAFPFGGGGYFRLYPYAVTKHLLKRANSEGRAVVFYVHPWEIDTGQPRQRVGLATRIRHYINIGREESRLRALWSEFSFQPLRERLTQ
jgi:polysaccharide deacetylase family protein (PEP-CTERM system associated)